MIYQFKLSLNSNSSKKFKNAITLYEKDSNWIIATQFHFPEYDIYQLYISLN